MTRFLGFETEQAAKDYQKEHGGYLVGKESKSKYKREEYNLVVVAGGLNKEKYPWALTWGNV